MFYFNSSMVRLKVVIDCSRLSNTFTFQFQYGAIESITRFQLTQLNSLFQFQYGAIERQKIQHKV